MAELDKTISVIESWLKQPVLTPPPINELYDALELLKEQEPVEPSTDIARNRRCPKCFTILKGKFCHECGQAVKWG